MPEMGTSGLMSGDAETGRRECATVPAPVPDSTCGGLQPASLWTPAAYWILSVSHTRLVIRLIRILDCEEAGSSPPQAQACPTSL